MFDAFLRAMAWLGARPRTQFALETGLSGLACVAYLAAVDGYSPVAAAPVGLVFGLTFAAARRLSSRYTS